MKLVSAFRPILAIMMALSLLAGCTGGATPPPVSQPADPGGSSKADPPSDSAPAEGAQETPRQETLYVNGLQWGPPTTSTC